MKIYIAGKITGDPKYREKFEKVASSLRGHGFSVMNPACLSEDKEFCWDDYMAITAAMQERCEATVLLPDWQDSKGARIELQTAERLGQKIYLWHTRVWDDLLIPFVSEHTPFGRCPSCRREFNSEIVDKYETIFCPWCGEKISMEEKQG
ncbi:MAG: DUF4406 domain-containing protein [Candidatus Treponema excrementipullorum]|nr:DUF4406 domain-containing protein [Candidatus Treponema excrementipullorum]